MSRGAGLAAGLLAVAALAGPGWAAGPSPAAGRGAVAPRFDLALPDGSPFPSDHLTVPDPGQRTGLRVALPLPDCRLAPSDCDEVRLLDELDGFDVAPRVAVPFTGPIDPASVTPRSVFLVRLAPGPPEAVGLERLVYDPAGHTLHGRPERLLEAETRYGLVVTRDVRDATGRPIAPAPGFLRFLAWRDGPPGARGYRQALRELLAALARRGTPAGSVAVAGVFTTGSVTAFLEQAREALDRRPPLPAVMTAPEEGGRAWFPRASLGRLTWRAQVETADGPGSVRESPLPVAALDAAAVGGVGIGWYWSPWYLTRDLRIVDTATSRPPNGVAVDAPIPFVIVLPAGRPPPGGWPVALFGHGYGGEMLGGALLVAGTLARHGIATAAITVVGHGGGPEGRLVVEESGGRRLTVRVPGRGIDLDGDGRIDRAEGLGPAPGGPLATLSVRDGLRQQVVDLMALARALGAGLDVDGDGVPDTARGGPAFYVGHSLGGIYGTLLLAVEPRVRVGVLSVPGGPIAEVARLSPAFRPLARDALGRRAPSLLNGGRDFREDLPLRGEGPVTAPAPGALAVQAYLARAEWLGRRGDPVAWARHLRAAPLAGLGPARVLVQLATGDRVVPNPTTSALVRAGELTDATALLRYDRVIERLAIEWREPHGFLLRRGAPGIVGDLARAAQEQVARFFLADGREVWSPEGRLAATGPGAAGPAALWEVPALALPDTP